jgi:hypothetical protein
MSRQLSRADGPLKMKKSSPDTYTGTLTLNVGADGMVGRSGADATCVPGYFRVKFGTTPQAQCYCPYCAKAAPPDSFFTPAQVDHIKALFRDEVIPAAHQMLREAFKVDSRGRRSLGDFVTIQLSDPPRPKAVTRPVEEELRRDLTCPYCGAGARHRSNPTQSFNGGSMAEHDKDKDKHKDKDDKKPKPPPPGPPDPPKPPHHRPVG